MASSSTSELLIEETDATSVALHTVDPLSDDRWDHFVASHPNASAFHHSGYLKALASTYGYRPVLLTRTPADSPLADGIVFCQVKSSITGNRLVSLPFADHCEPLLSDNADCLDLKEWMSRECSRNQWKYVEFRPLDANMHLSNPLVPDQSFWFHLLSLEPSVERIFDGLHKDSFQRRIRRAEREQLSYDRGCSDAMVEDFYRLLVITRKRHRLLPQPKAWFRNLVTYMGDKVQIRLARKDNIPLAAVLTLHHRNTVVYKYGCSDEKFHHLAAMPFLLWKLIEGSRAEGAEQLDLGRTDLDNDGLISFKDRLGAKRKQITYFRYPEGAMEAAVARRKVTAAKHLFALIPNGLLPAAGRIAYRHLG